MYLTKQEELMLQGELGPAVQKAMEVLVALGKIYGAERMVEVGSAHVASISYKGSGEAGMKFVERLAETGASFKVPTSLNPLSIDPENWMSLGFPAEIAEKQLRTVEAYRKLGGVSCYSCIPHFLGNTPRFGQHVAWAESSALVYVNSVMGARTNREGGIAALASGLTGRTPLFGFHLDENRQGQVLIKVKADLNSQADYAALGYYVGSVLGEKTPVFVNIPKDASTSRLKTLGAALASSGAVALFHIVGVTPEAPSMEHAFGGKKPQDRVDVGRDEIKSTYEHLCTREGGEVDYVAVGCPHCTIDEIAEAAKLLRGSRVKKNVNFWVYTASPIKLVADRMGYTSIIEESGGKLVCSNCMVLTYTDRIGFKSMATNSAKAAHYCPGLCKLDVFFGTLEDCVKAAITGMWGE